MSWILLNTILCLSLLLLLWIRKRKKRFSLFKELGIPGPEPNFWFGNFNEFIQKRERCLSEYSEKYGQIFGCFLGARPFLVITDLDLIKTIQIKEFKWFSNRDVVLPDSGVPHHDISFALPVTKDDEWKRIRTIASPSFSTSKLRKVVPIINDSINHFLEKIAEKNCKKFDITLLYRNLTMDISSKIDIGIETGVQRGENTLFLKSVSLVLDADSTDPLAGISVCFPETEPVPTTLRLVKDKIMHFLGRKSIATLFEIMQDVITRRRNCKERCEDVLQSLIDSKVDATKISSIQDSELIASRHYQQKEQTEDVNDSEERRFVSLSDQSIKATALTFLTAGFETTSSTIGFMTYYLTKYQDIQDKVREEINACIEGADIEYEDIFKLQYLDQVISETLRLHSLSMMSTSRIAKKDYRYKGLIIPKGLSVCFPSYLLHRNPEYWPEPEKFDPDRFSSANKSKIDPTIYQPFGNGPRNCIGMRLAQIMMKFIFVRLLKSYRIETERKGELEIKFSLFVSRPKEVMVKAIPI